MDIYPYKFEPLYKEKIWGGRNLDCLFGRALPAGRQIGESWELTDIPEGTSIVANGPTAGATLTDLTAKLGAKLLGRARPTAEGRFPLILKWLDANDRLSLQVHPDAAAARRIGGGATPKTECWYVIESRGGCIYKGLKPGVTPEDFRRAIEADRAEELVARYDVAAGDFHYLPPGTVHALGAGVVVAEAQTPSDTTYRMTDWGRGRQIHPERSMECIHFHPADDGPPGARGDRLLRTDYFEVHLRDAKPGEHGFAGGRCTAWMILSGRGVVGGVEFAAGDTLLLPAALRDVTVRVVEPSKYLEIVPGEP